MGLFNNSLVRAFSGEDTPAQVTNPPIMPLLAKELTGNTTIYLPDTQKNFEAVSPQILKAAIEEIAATSKVPGNTLSPALSTYEHYDSQVVSEMTTRVVVPSILGAGELRRLIDKTKIQLNQECIKVDFSSDTLSPEFLHNALVQLGHEDTELQQRTTVKINSHIFSGESFDCGSLEKFLADIRSQLTVCYGGSLTEKVRVDPWFTRSGEIKTSYKAKIISDSAMGSISIDSIIKAFDDDFKKHIEYTTTPIVTAYL